MANNIEKTDFTAKDLIEFRKNYNLSQRDLAETLGVSMTTIKFWENKTRNIPEPMRRLLVMFRANKRLMEEF